MNVAVSYFAQLRNFKPNMVPVSTALFDPKWFHDNKDVKHKFIDKRGVLNGVRCKDLAPGPTCNTLCGGTVACSDRPESCSFIKKYKEQLDDLNKDKFKQYCENVVKCSAELLGIPEESIVLVFMVYEKYNNPCSERSSLLEFLNDCGFDAAELSYPIA